MIVIDLQDPPDIQEITTAQLKQLLGGTVANMSDEALEDLIETGGFDAPTVLPRERFRVHSNCDGTHFLVHIRHRDIQWPPKCIQPSK